jgi:dTDP-4-dehydrorhamnose reductase
MRILLIGGSGQLGSDLLRNKGGRDIVAPNRFVLDLERISEATSMVKSLHPDVLINCAAFHNVPLCEVEGERAFRINCLAVRDLAGVCEQIGARFVTFSTDYVFNGTQRTPYAEHDQPAPIQIYGISRVAGEYAALAVAPGSAMVIRTCGLYGQSGAQSKGGNFVDKRVAEARMGGLLEMGDDQTVCPTYTEDLSRAVFALIEHPEARPGIYHLVNEGECTWYEFTRAIIELLSLPTRVAPVDRGGRTGSMRRPLYSVLANRKAAGLGIKLPHWRDALDRYLGTKYIGTEVRSA